MTDHKLSWHLARDNHERLATFCGKYWTYQEVTNRYEVDGKAYFTITYHFDNGGYITAELRAGDTKSYSVFDHFQVVDYELGKCGRLQTV